MSTRNIRISIVSLLLALCTMFMLVLTVGTNQGTKAEEAVFQFETTAYAKLKDNGGLRFRLKMNEAAKTAIGSNSITLYAASKANAESANDVAAWDALKEANKAWKNEIAAERIYIGQASDNLDDGYFYLNYLLDINGLGAEYQTTDFVAFAVCGDLNATSEPANLQNAVALANLYGYESEVARVYTWFDKNSVDVEDTEVTAKYVVSDFNYESDSDEYILALLDSKYTIKDLKEDIGGFKFEISKDLKLTCQYSGEVEAKLGADKAAIDAAISSCKITKLSDMLTTATFTVNDVTFVVYLTKTESGFASRISVKLQGVTTDITFNLAYVKE